MKILKVKLENFRGYKEEVTVDFNDLTVFVGKNDIGKSTILEALDIFFNDGKGLGIVKLDKDDINKQAKDEGNTETKITVVFDDLPNQIIIDSTNPSTLNEEYLLNIDGKLEVIKKYSNAGAGKVFIKANHPTYPNCQDLLLKKIKDLQKILNDDSITCEHRAKSAVVRKAIWEHYNSVNGLELQEIEIDVTKEDAKNIWEQLKNYMPLYSLFQSDRKNSDGDSEVQNPMKLAVQEILKDTELQQKLLEVATEVQTKLQEIASNTLEKLNEMNPEIANSLNPVIPTAESLKWNEVFKSVSITGDDDIPINKRGSGVKRLVLLNFFRAEAERRQREQNTPSIIYAIEEPETSQHPSHQRKLIEAFIALSNTDRTQVILTTHSPAIVKMLDFEHLKLIKNENGKEIINIERGNLPYPSLNEVNFLAFGESNDEYHNELYGYIESENELSNYKNGKATVNYNKVMKNNGTINSIQIIKSEYIRHQIHHPENKSNPRFTHIELQQSIDDMRIFIRDEII